jgi:hypothetical protein
LTSADWREVSRIVLHIDPGREPDRARRAFDSHLVVHHDISLQRLGLRLQILERPKNLSTTSAASFIVSSCDISNVLPMIDKTSGGFQPLVPVCPALVFGLD